MTVIYVQLVSSEYYQAEHNYHCDDEFRQFSRHLLSPPLAVVMNSLTSMKTRIIFKGELNPKIQFVLFERTPKITE